MEALLPAATTPLCACLPQLRLTVSGSAACPTPIMEQWQQLSGALDGRVKGCGHYTLFTEA